MGLHEAKKKSGGKRKNSRKNPYRTRFDPPPAHPSVAHITPPPEWLGLMAGEW